MSEGEGGEEAELTKNKKLILVSEIREAYEI